MNYDLFLKTSRNILLAMVGTISSTQISSAEILIFNQTSASVPGLVINSVIDVDGGLNALPTVDNFFPPPGGSYDFGNLKSFDILLPITFGQSQFTLDDFTERASPPNPGVLNFPQWSISPNQIRFNDSNSDFGIIFGSVFSTISFNSDGPTIPFECRMTGACVVQGQWRVTSVPVPGSLPLFIGALVAGAFVFRRRGRSQARGDVRNAA